MQKKLAALALVATLAGCGTTQNLAAPKVGAPKAMAAAAAKADKIEAATPELLNRLLAGHRAYQGRTIVGPGNKDAALLTSYDGKQLTLEGKGGVKRQTALFFFKYITPTVTLADGTTLNFTSQEFLTKAKSEAYLATLPVDKQATFTFTVRRFSYRSDANSPFVFDGATAK